jgi:phenylacetate-CoA ligase
MKAGTLSALGSYRNLAFRPPDEQRRAQETLLRAHLSRCQRHSPYYAATLGGVQVDSFRLEDVASLPVTTKEDIERRNADFLAVAPERVVDIVLSSGTTGKPTRIMYTESDLQRLAYNEELSFASCGFTARDIVLLTCTMDRCFIAGLAYFLGIRRLGAAAIRNGHGSLESHLAVIREMATTGIVGVPSFLRKLGQYIRHQGADPRALGIRKLVCIGEPLRGRDMKLLKLGEDLEDLWHASVYSTYASSEIVTTFCECVAQCGGHLHPDLGIVEILDDYGVAVPEGDAGEVAFTPFGTEGMPLIRFRTGDISFLLTGPCACGRLSPRLGPIIGRKKQMLKVRGTTLYPQALYAALDEIPGVSEFYVEAFSECDLSDQLRVHVAVADPRIDVREIQDRIQARVRVKPEVVVEPDAAVRERVFDARSRKPIRFFDLRKPLS